MDPFIEFISEGEHDVFFNGYYISLDFFNEFGINEDVSYDKFNEEYITKIGEFNVFVKVFIDEDELNEYLDSTPNSDQEEFTIIDSGKIEGAYWWLDEAVIGEERRSGFYYSSGRLLFKIQCIEECNYEFVESLMLGFIDEIEGTGFEFYSFDRERESFVCGTSTSMRNEVYVDANFDNDAELECFTEAIINGCESTNVFVDTIQAREEMRLWKGPGENTCILSISYGDENEIYMDSVKPLANKYVQCVLNLETFSKGNYSSSDFGALMSVVISFETFNPESNCRNTVIDAL